MKLRSLLGLLAAILVLTVGSLRLSAQETTGGMHGTVKDATGAVVPQAKVAITSTSMMGSKEVETDASGYYHFSNLPPGDYTVTVSMKGFAAIRRGGVTIQVGHLPTVDFQLEVGDD